MELEELEFVLNKLLAEYRRLKKRNEELKKMVTLYKEREKVLQKRVEEIEKQLQKILEKYTVVEG
jgi:chaperonin cofactor prefoldin